MPIYEYSCSECDELSDVLQKVSDPTPEECPRCSAKGTLEKQVSRTSFILKGGGWYKDLYGSTKPDSKGSSDSSSSSSSATSDGASGGSSGDSSGGSATKSEPKAEKSSSGEGGGSSTASPAKAAAGS